MDVTPNFTVFLHVLIQTDPGEQFQKHCREIYGATPDLIKEIWSSYTYYLSEINFLAFAESYKKIAIRLGIDILKSNINLRFSDTSCLDVPDLINIITSSHTLNFRKFNFLNEKIVYNIVITLY